MRRCDLCNGTSVVVDGGGVFACFKCHGDGRAPLTVADAMTVPEVRALVASLDRDPAARHHLDGLWAAMKEVDRG